MQAWGLAGLVLLPQSMVLQRPNASTLRGWTADKRTTLHNPDHTGLPQEDPDWKGQSTYDRLIAVPTATMQNHNPIMHL